MSSDCPLIVPVLVSPGKAERGEAMLEMASLLECLQYLLSSSHCDPVGGDLCQSCLTSQFESNFLCQPQVSLQYFRWDEYSPQRDGGNGRAG